MAAHVAPAEASSSPFQHQGVSRTVEARVGRLMKLLEAGGYPNSTDLAKALHTSRETIQRDLRFLREARQVPVVYDRSRHGYCLQQPKAEMRPGIVASAGGNGRGGSPAAAARMTAKFEPEEVLALFIAGTTMQPPRGRLQRTVAGTLRRIAAACPEALSVPWQELEDAFSARKAAGVAQADVKLFGRLLNAVVARREVAFHYHKLTDTKRERREAQPYHIAQMRDGWYLIAKDLARGGMRTFALQRMTALEVRRTKFQRDADFDLEGYLRSGFGAWSYEADAERLQVRIRFTGWAARVVPERLWHESQQITALNEDASEIEFRAEVAGLEKLTSWILSHGRHAQVQGPPELRQRVREELQAMTAAMRASRVRF